MKYLSALTKLILCASLCMSLACSASKHADPAFIITKPTSDSIRYVGRIKHLKDSVQIFWPATSIRFKFHGTTAKVWMKDQHGKNYFNVIIDNDSVRYFKPDSVKAFYTLVENLPGGDHVIEISKRTEWDEGYTWFYGLWTDGSLMGGTPPNKHVMEFFGDSITAGYAIDDTTTSDSPDSTNTNSYYTYAMLTSRHFNADCYLTVKSGIGVTVSWFPLIMSELYDRLDPSDATSRWAFTAKPQIVVINLFQNDSWLIKMPSHESYRQRFGTKQPDENIMIRSYEELIRKVRTVYPDAEIICALGPMDAVKPGKPWTSYIDTAVRNLHDKKIRTLYFPWMNKPGHPRRADNQKMAGQLIDFIERNIAW
jgi:hypothetical protein